MAVKLDRILIIGSGIGGLSAAIALRRAGYRVEVYEQAAEIASVGAGLALWANAMRGLAQLGITETMLAGNRVQRAALLAADGRVLSAYSMADVERKAGAPTVAVHRASLQQALLASLPQETLHTGRVCVGFEMDAGATKRGIGVRACFADQQAAQGSLLVGADGIRSVVRQQLYPQVRLRYAGYTAWRGVVDFPQGAAEEQTSESWGCGERFGIVPLGGGKIYWFATANSPAGRKLDPTEQKRELLQRFRGWHAPVEDLIAATPPDQILHNDIFDIPPMLHWSADRVTLLGDAAHPTTPNMAQGAGQAIESSLTLARCLAEETSLAAALARYERERHPRTAWITQQSWRIGQVAQWQTPWLCAIRNKLVQLTPRAMMRGPLEKAVYKTFTR